MAKAHKGRPATYTGVPKAQAWPVGTPPPVAAGEADDAGTAVPPVSASKATWVAYAETLDVDTFGLSKAEIVELLT